MRRLWEGLRPFSFGGVYVNFLSDEGEDRVRAAYGPAKYERLVALKDALRSDQPVPPQPEHPADRVTGVARHLPSWTGKESR